MKAAVLTDYGKFVWQEVPMPAMNDQQVLIRVDYAGICGSDMHIFSGDFHPRTHTPMIPGHEFAGIIVEAGAAVRSFQRGDRVTVDPIIWCGQCAACQAHHYPACTTLKLLGIDMDGGFAEFVAADESMLYKVDSRISARDAALIEIYSIGFHACQRSGVKADDTLVIWGSGRVGQAILQAARTITENTIFMVDVLDHRLAAAAGHFDRVVAINATKQDPVSVILDHTSGRGVDIAFEAVGHSQAIADRPHPVRGCIQSIHGAGVVCVLGLADEPAPLVMKELIYREAKIVASRVSHGEFSQAISHLAQGHLKPEVMVSLELAAEEAQKAFELLKSQPHQYLKVLLKLA